MDDDPDSVPGRAPARATPGHGGATGIRWRVLGLLVLLSFVAYVLRTNMSVAGDSMMRELGLTQVQLGVILGAFAWGYAIFQFPGGVLGDIAGGRRALTWIAIAWGVVTLLTGMIPARDLGGPFTLVTALFGLRFFLGVVQAPIFPVLGGVVGNWFPVSGWALPNGLSSSGLTLGAAATGPLIAWLAESVGWRLSFVLTAPLAFAAAALWWWYARDRPAEHAAVNASEKALIEADRRVDPGLDSAAGPEPGAWRLVLRDRNVLLLAASYFCMNYVFYIFFNWFFIYLVQVRGLGALAGGFAATAPWLVGAVGAAVGGLWCDRLSKRRGIRMGCRVPGVVCLPLVAALLLAGAAAESPAVAVTLLALSFGCTQLTEGAYWSATISVAGRHAAAAGGVLNTGGNIVGGFGAVFVPLVAERFGWMVALSTGSLFALLGAALWLLIRADEPMRA
jgi:ACS family glucarate transporter-like MFS transporter